MIKETIEKKCFDCKTIYNIYKFFKGTVTSRNRIINASDYPYGKDFYCHSCYCKYIIGNITIIDKAIRYKYIQEGYNRYPNFEAILIAESL